MDRCLAVEGIHGVALGNFDRIETSNFKVDVPSDDGVFCVKSVCGQWSGEIETATIDGLRYLVRLEMMQTN